MGELETGGRTFSRIFSLSFSGKKIAIQILGLLDAFIAYSVIRWIGGALLQDALAPAVATVAWVAVVIIMFLTWGAIAKITVAEVAELPPVDMKGAIRSTLRNASPLIVAPLKIVLIILILGIIHMVAGWIGLIPVVGEIVWPFFAIPLFLLSALIVVAFIILLCGALLLPTIIMAGKESPVSELNDFLREHTLRFIGLLVATLVVVIVVNAFLTSVIVTNAMISDRAMGDKYEQIVSRAPARLYTVVDQVSFIFMAPLKSAPLRGYQTMLCPVTYSAGRPVDTTGLRWTYTFAGVVWGIFTFIINLAIRSLPLVIFSVAGTLIYLGLKPAAAPKG
ncbi:MAG: hypothetical protein PHN82_06920 [bacterium]|nr:hypothetical protein [bacterium]